MVKKKEVYDVTLTFNDGHKEKLYHIETVGIKGGVLLLRESNDKTVHVPVNNLAFWTREEV